MKYIYEDTTHIYYIKNTKRVHSTNRSGNLYGKAEFDDFPIRDCNGISGTIAEFDAYPTSVPNTGEFLRSRTPPVSGTIVDSFFRDRVAFAVTRIRILLHRYSNVDDAILPTAPVMFVGENGGSGMKQEGLVSRAAVRRELVY